METLDPTNDLLNMSHFELLQAAVRFVQDDKMQDLSTVELAVFLSDNGCVVNPITGKIEQSNRRTGHMRTRLTAGDDRNDIMAEIKTMERRFSRVAADDAELESVADDIANAEVQVAEENTDVEVDAKYLGQNARAMKNWPISASSRKQIAKILLREARAMLG